MKKKKKKKENVAVCQKINCPITFVWFVNQKRKKKKETKWLEWTFLFLVRKTNSQGKKWTKIGGVTIFEFIFFDFHFGFKVFAEIVSLTTLSSEKKKREKTPEYINFCSYLG